MKQNFPDYTYGASLKLWSEYFNKSKIVGWDIIPCPKIENYNIETYVVNAANKTEVDNFFNNNNYKFDIIIDDGSHDLYDQTNAFLNLHNYLEKNGIYIIEDILPQNIDKFKSLCAFSDDDITNIIKPNYDITYYDTREISQNSNDFIMSLKKI